MQTYVINGYTIAYASYQSDNNPNIIIFWDENYQYVVDVNVSNSMVNEYVNVLGLLVRPWRPEYHKWDDVNEVWVLDNVQFTPHLKEELKNHRNTKLTTEVSFNGISAFNTPEERNLIVSIIAFLQAEGEEQSLEWKQPNDEFTMATVADFQGLVKVGGRMTQNAFKTEAYIISQHEMSPYTSVSTALSDFDTYFNSL